MKKRFVLFLLLISAFNLLRAQTSGTSPFTHDTIKVYSFHYTVQCEESRKLQDETYRILEEKYAEPLESRLIRYREFQVEDTLSKPLVEKYNVAGQALLIIQKNFVRDLTSEGFQYILSRPDKFDRALISVIDNFIYR